MSMQNYADSKNCRHWLLALALTTGLAACTSSGTKSIDNMQAGSAEGQTASADNAKFDGEQDPRAYCPKIVMRAGTQSIDIYPKDVRINDPTRPSKLRFRGTINELVRECSYAGDNLQIKVGIAGVVLSGPSGETGDFTMPIRVVVTHGDNLLYSQLHEVSAQIPAGRKNNSFSFVDDSIVIPKPESQNIIIYAGYDEQRVDVPGAQPASEGLRPIN
jgi:hypothetical protein